MGGGELPISPIRSPQPRSEMTHFKFNLTTNLPHDFQKQESMRQEDTFKY